MSSTATWLHNIPRRTFSGQSVQPSLFVSHSGPYYESIWEMAIVPISFGVLSLITFIIFSCIRNYCDRCGGKEPREEGYTVIERRGVKIAIWCLTPFILAMIVLSIVGNSEVQPALTHSMNHLYAQSLIECSILQSIQPKILYADNDHAYSFLTTLYQDGFDTINNVQNGKNFLFTYNTWRIVLISLAFAFTFLSVFLACLGSIFNMSRVLWTAASAGALGMFFMWFVFALHFPISAVVSDMCYDISVYTIPKRLQDRVNNNGTFGGLNSITMCPSFVSSNDALTLVTTLINQYSNPPNQTVLSILNITKIECEEVKMCDWLISAWEPLENDVCGKPFTGLVLIWVGCVINSILLIPLTVLSIIGSKRFQTTEGFY